MTDTTTAACTACGATLEPVFDRATNQFDNALHIRFEGGYGEFVDAPFHDNDLGTGPDSLRVVICHDCAHALADSVAWIARILNPSRSHTHRAGREH